jgi:hypothetical protein
VNVVLAYFRDKNQIKQRFIRVRRT